MSRMGSNLQRDGVSGAFPTLEADLDDELRRQGKAKRICIATPDILGPVKNGGIGTAYYHMARLLVGWGHEVVIAYVNGNASNAELMEESRAFYAGFDVAFEPIVPRPANKTTLGRVSAPTWALYDWLRARERPFDIVQVSDWHGLGYGPLLAKLLGLAFGATHFVVKCSSPTLWAIEGNRQLLSEEQELGWVFMERRSVELADTVICGSAHLLEWMDAAGYAMPPRAFVWPNPFPAPDPSSTAAAERAARDGAALEEVVFFGRLEPRKGLILFVDAIERLVRQDRAPARVTFLGKVSKRIDGVDLIRSSTRDWPVEVRAITDFGSTEAVSYLSQPGRLAVIPSLLENSSNAVLECLQAGIPFAATATGGTPELVAPEDRARVLVAPDHIALGDRIAELADGPLRAVRPRWGFERSLEIWSRWYARSAPLEAAAERFAQKVRAAGAETPLVTVCVVHHERPKLVRMAVDSVLAQDYPALDAVLVDDGSESTEALAALEGLEAEFAERGWRVIRQENRYLGAARNAAVAAARGEWLLFLDDDNVLFPDAVSRLVRAARFSGADCVPAASIRFFGNGDPWTDTASRGTPRRFLGTARAWSRLRNVVGDACALVRREAFEAVGGFTEEYRVGLDDLSFFNSLIQAGYRIEPMPDPAYYYRIADTSMRSRNRSAEAERVRVLAPYVKGLPAEERALADFTISQTMDTINLAGSQPFRGVRARRTAILVSGMHRSGTSALTRVLNILGCDLPKTLTKPKSDNVAGFWESRAITDLNDEILASAGSSWDDWLPFDQSWHTSPIADRFRERALRLVEDEFGNSRLLVLKDPRICRLLGFWIEIVEAYGARPLVVLPIRSPFDVASSLQVRNDIDPFTGQLIWLRHVLDAEAASRSLKRAFLRYEQLLSEPQALIDRLANDLGVSWPKRSSPYAQMQVDEFLSSALRHHDSEDAGHRSNPRLSTWIKTGFEIFDRWSRGEAREEDIPELDRIKAALDDATPAFSHAMAAGRAAQRESRVLSQRLDDSRNETAERETRIQSLSQRLEASRGKTAERDTRIQSLSQRLEASRGKTTEREARIQSLSQRLEASRGKTAEREARIQSLSQRLEASRGKTAERETRIQSLSQRLEASRGKTAERETRIQSLSQRLEASRGKTAERETRIQSLSQRLEASRGKTAERDTRIQSLSQRLEASRGKTAEREARIRTLSKRLEASRSKTAERHTLIQTLSQRLEASRNETAERDTLIRTLSQRLEASRNETAERDTLIRTLSQRLEASRGKTTEREARIQSLSQRLEASRGKTAERDTRIRTLSQRLKASRGKTAERDTRIQTLSQRLEASRGKTTEREARIQSLSQRLEASRGKTAERDTRIRTLSQRLKASRNETAERETRIQTLSQRLEIAQKGHVMALSHRISSLGIDKLQANILINPELIDQHRQRHRHEPNLELRCNGRVVGRASVLDMPHNLARVAVELRLPTVRDSVYSMHDTLTGETLAALTMPPTRRSRRIVGAVETPSRAEVRGWILDLDNPKRRRRVAVHVDGILHEVIDADEQRSDIAHQKSTDGQHGFVWRIPERLAAMLGARIDAFDADTGHPLRGSPIQINTQHLLLCTANGTLAK